MSLRTVFSVPLVSLLLVVLAISAAMVSAMHRLTTDAAHLSSLVNRVDRADDLEVDLLVYDKAGDPVIAAGRAERLIELLDEARGHESRGSAKFASIEEAVRAYLATPNDSTLTRSYRRIEDLVNEDRRENSRLIGDIVRWQNRFAAAVVGLSAALILGIVLMLIWFRGFTLHPILDLNQAVRSLTAGDRTACVPARGPREIREICASFEVLRDALKTQRDNQLAFLGGVAHDLRNPLTAMRLATEVLNRGKPVPEERLRGALAIAARQVDRLDRLVGDLLDVTRLEAGQLALKLETVDLRLAVDETMALVRRAHPDRAIALERPAYTCPVWADSQRLEQVLMNLLSNAVKYSPEAAPIDINVGIDGNEAVVAVRDHGDGLSDEAKGMLFRPYRRLVSGTQSPSGLGLGLYFAHNIVQAHGGRIEVADAPERGTIFRVRLPVALATAGA